MGINGRIQPDAGFCSYFSSSRWMAGLAGIRVQLLFCFSTVVPRVEEKSSLSPGYSSTKSKLSDPLDKHWLCSVPEPINCKLSSCGCECIKFKQKTESDSKMFRPKHLWMKLSFCTSISNFRLKIIFVFLEWFVGIITITITIFMIVCSDS